MMNNEETSSSFLNQCSLFDIVFLNVSHKDFTNLHYSSKYFFSPGVAYTLKSPFSSAYIR
jgi:hypothetical protein